MIFFMVRLRNETLNELPYKVTSPDCQQQKSLLYNSLFYLYRYEIIMSNHHHHHHRRDKDEQNVTVRLL